MTARRSTILITGSTDGIGKQTALELAAMGKTVIVHGRSREKCLSTIAQLRAAVPSARLESVVADLSVLENVRQLAGEVRERFPSLHVLVNNAGVYMKERRLTRDGLEMTFAVNHLAPFLLTLELLELLRRNAPARVVTVSSVSHTRGAIEFDNLQGERYFRGYDAYARSKLANVLFTYELALRLKGTGVTATCLHPGVIDTKLLRTGFDITGAASLKAGATTSVFLAASPEAEGVTGAYYSEGRRVRPSTAVEDPELRRRFWEVSAALSGLSPD